jgi:hypothetical protein
MPSPNSSQPQQWNTSELQAASAAYGVQTGQQLAFPLPSTNDVSTQMVTAIGAPAGRTLAEHVATLPDAVGNTLPVTATGSSTARTLAERAADTVKVKDYGAVGDGVTDDTAALQAALTFDRLQGNPLTFGRGVEVTRGTYLVTSAITVGSSQYVVFRPGVVLNFRPPVNVETTSLFTIANQDTVVMQGNGAVINGYRSAANPATEGNAAAFFIYGSDNVDVSDFVINDMPTDGITVDGDDGASGVSQNVTLRSIVANNNRRNGLSIIAARGLRVIGGEFKNSNGAPNGPFAGIDIEPNAHTYSLEDVQLIGVQTSGNAGAGVQVTPGALAANAGNHFQVTIVGGSSYNDGALAGTAGLHFTNGGTFANKVFGGVDVRGFTVRSPKSRGVNFRNWDADLAPRVLLDDVRVYNPDSTGAASANEDRTGFVIYADATQAISSLGNIVMRDCLAEDSRGSPRMVWGVKVRGTSGKTVANVRIENQRSVNFTAALKAHVNADVSAASVLTNVDAVWTRPDPFVTAGSLDMTGGGLFGQRVQYSGAGALVTLPLAASCAGAHVEIVSPLAGSTSIAPQAAEIIQWPQGVAGDRLILDDYAVIVLRSTGATGWIVESSAGSIRRQGAGAGRKLSWATAAPTTQTWAVGDVVFNQAPAVGQPKGWRCTVAGTPGTWVSEGNL